MSRVKIPRGKQKEFLNSVQKATGLDWVNIARLCNISQRSLRDWRGEKCNMSYEALGILHKISKLPFPNDIKVLPEHWNIRKISRTAALKRYELFGNPGTPEGRRKGGINSQKRFYLNPNYARKIGVVIRKNITQPPFSASLAEFVGIILGDGGISEYQVYATFNRQTDAKYSLFLQKIIRKLFSIPASIVFNKTDKGMNVVVSSKNLVEFLEKIGLRKGNKMEHQVDIPDWIWRDKKYQIACLRGLIDTDGSFYSYNNKVYNKRYYNIAMGFTNYSKPILKSVYNILESLGFNPTMSRNNRVYLYKKKNVEKYFLEIGTHNPKHQEKYDNYRYYSNKDN